MSKRRASELGQFFTRADVAALLVDLIPEDHVNSILDLGVGEGMLSNKARQRWPKARLITVDIDARWTEHLRSEPLSQPTSLYDHIESDIFAADLADLVRNASGLKRGVEVALCNPPYGRMEAATGWPQRETTELPESLLGTIPNSEVAFLDQALRMTRKGGFVAMIMPDSFVTAARWAPLRKYLVETHQFDRVVQLSRRSFIGTEAQAYLCLLRKNGGRANAITLEKFHDGALGTPIRLDASAGISRLDYDFHGLRNFEGRTFTLEEVGAVIDRGTITSAQARILKSPTFHVGDFPSERGAALRLQERQSRTLTDPRQTIVAGDIVMARVGKNLHRKVAYVVAGMATMTDCIFRVRVPNISRGFVLAALASEVGAGTILAHSKGVGANYLSKSTLLRLPLPILSGAQ